MRKLFTIIILLNLSSCVNFAVPINAKTPVHTEKAYIYGVFYLSNAFSHTEIDADPGAFDLGKNTINNREGVDTLVVAFNKKSKNGGSLYIPFTTKKLPYVVEVDAGEYRLPLLGYYLYTHGEIVKQRKIYESDLSYVQLEAGKAYYMGDFTGESSLERLVGAIRYTWKVTNIENNYDATKEWAIKLYPNVKNLKHVSFLKLINKSMMQAMK